MNEKRKTKVSKKVEKVTDQAAAKASRTIKLRPLKIERVAVVLEGLPGSPLIVHAWSHKAEQEIILGQTEEGAKRKIREMRDPQQEFEDSRYRLPDGSDGFPLVSLKNAIVTAADNSLGVAKTVMRKALFLEEDGFDAVRPEKRNPLVRILSEPPRRREDIRRIGGTTASPVWRPEYMPWEMRVKLTYDAELLSAEAIFNLFERAGYGVGIGEWRPENGGICGRFRVKA